LLDYPKGWVYLTSAQKYYRAIFELVDWNKANLRCRELSAYSRLVDINDATENAAIKQFIASFDGTNYTLAFVSVIKDFSRRTHQTRHNETQNTAYNTWDHSNNLSLPSKYDVTTWTSMLQH